MGILSTDLESSTKVKEAEGDDFQEQRELWGKATLKMNLKSCPKTGGMLNVQYSKTPKY